MQSVEDLSKFSSKTRSFLCPNCTCPNPRLTLAKLLERMWSTISTNPQGLPFFCPLLPGVPKPSSMKSSEPPLDFLYILMQIRQCHYANSREFLRDITKLVTSAKEILGDASAPLTEAADTVLWVVKEQLHIHQQKIVKAVEDVFKAEKRQQKYAAAAGGVTSSELENGGISVSLTSKYVSFGV